ncbi:MAG: WG repeat-containing protein [Bacteroidales bacterium]
MKKAIALFMILGFVLNIVAQPTFEKLYAGSDGIISLGGDFYAVKKDSKWAVMRNSVLVLDFYYDSIDVISDGIITYLKNNQVGFSDTVGNVITLANYFIETPYNRSDESILNVFQCGSALVYDGEKLILLGKDGKQINDNDCEIISKADDVVIFKRKAAYGLMDAKGNIIVQNKYRRIQTVIAGELYAYTTNKNGIDYLGLIDKKGTIKSEAQYDDLTVVNKKDKFYIKGFTSTGKQALYDIYGNMLFSPMFQNIEPINSNDYFIYTDNGRKGLIGRDYITFIPAAYDKLQMTTLHKDTFFIAKNDQTTYILNKDNKMIDIINGDIKDLISYDSHELIYIADSMLNYGIRSSQNGWLVKPKYLDIFAQSKGIFVVMEKDRWGGIDMNGQIKIPFEYKKVRASNSKTCIVFYDGRNNSILLKDNGQKMEFPKTKNVLPMSDYVEYKIKKERIRLYFDGMELKDKFKIIGANKGGVLCAKDKKGWSYFDSKTYKPLTDEYFDMVTGFVDGVAYVVRNKKLFQIDRNFNIIQTVLDDNYLDINNLAVVLSMSKLLQQDAIIVVDKNKKKTLLKINR